MSLVTAREIEGNRYKTYSRKGDDADMDSFIGTTAEVQSRFRRDGSAEEGGDVVQCIAAHSSPIGRFDGRRYLCRMANFRI